MNSSLGNNLSELDRLLLELNAVQQSTPAFPTEGTQRDYVTVYERHSYVPLKELRCHVSKFEIGQ